MLQELLTMILQHKAEGHRTLCVPINLVDFYLVEKELADKGYDIEWVNGNAIIRWG